MNREWRNLKASDDGMLTWDSWIPYILYVIKNGEETTKKVIEKRIVEYFSLPDELIQKRYDSDQNGEGQPILFNRMGFVLSLLHHSGSLDRPRRAIYQITEKGLDLLREHGDSLDDRVLSNQEGYKRYKNELKLRNEKKDTKSSVDTNYQLEEYNRIDLSHVATSRNNEVAVELLDKLQKSSPRFFEKTVVNLLDNMGYSGENGETKVTSLTNDGGIEGLINQDPLGTSTVYIQAKRYSDKNTVSKPEIQSFFGALAEIRADRGVFITTSRFSSGAHQ